MPNLPDRPSVPDQTEDIDAMLSRELVEEALAPMRQLLTPEGYMLLRAEMICQMLMSPAGRAQLQRLKPAPTVERSGEVTRGEASDASTTNPSAGKKRAGGEP